MPVNAEAGDPQQSEPRRLAWLHAAADKLPTSWLAGLGTAAFLAVTAAFGGLAPVAATPLAELTAGDEHVNTQLSVVVERAVLIDDFPEAGVRAEPGQRVLTLVLKVENRWTKPLPPRGDESVSQAVRLPALGDVPPETVARLDDATMSPWLQPGVPARLAATWAVDDEAFAGGEDLTVDLRDASLHTGRFVRAGDYWDDLRVAAHVTVVVEDLGAGAGAEGEQ